MSPEERFVKGGPGDRDSPPRRLKVKLQEIEGGAGYL